MVIEKMEECKVLENALKSCQVLETTLNDSIKLVRRLNMRYNLDNLVIHCHAYVNQILDKYNCKNNSDSDSDDNLTKTVAKRTKAMVKSMKMPIMVVATPTLTIKRSLPLKSTISKHATSSLHLIGSSSSPPNLCVNKSLRTTHQVIDNNLKINYKFIKIKRSMEAVLIHIQRAMHIANRQRNFTHVNSFDYSNRASHMCCH